MADKKYKITNYGNTRSIYVNGLTWEIPKNGSITTTDKEVADAYGTMFAIDVEVIEQPKPKPKKKVVRKKTAKKKIAGRKKPKSKKRKRKVA